MQKISRYIILLNSILFCSILHPIAAQDKKDTTNIKAPVYQGFTIEFDAVPLAETISSNGEKYGMQGNIQVNLKRSYFPVLELGYGGSRKTLANQISYKSSGLYEKIGIDFNLMKQKPGTALQHNFLLAGIRLGMSHFNYNINNIPLTDTYWGGSDIINISQPTTKVWIEIVASMRVEIYKRIMMGWSIRNKHLFGNLENGNYSPWYIQGYGKSASSVWGFSYVIGYRF